RLLLLQVGQEPLERGLLVLEVALLRAQRVLGLPELRARRLQLLGVVVVDACRGVAELLAPGAVERAAGEDVDRAGAVAAGRVQRDGALAQVVEERVADL